MEVRYSCNLADYAEVLTTASARTLGRKMFGAVIGIVLIILSLATIVNLGLSQRRAAITGMILFPALMLVYKFVVFPWWVRRDFRGHPNFSRDQTVRIDDDGLHKRSEVGQSETKWSAYTRFGETQNLFLLYLGERSIEAVPKRAFSNEQLEELRQLLRKEVPGNANTVARGSASVSLA
jgi:hypothetical protein